MIKKVLFVLCIFFNCGIVISQNNYSLNALTGNGDLELVGDSAKLQKEVNEAFQQMKKAAIKDGIEIKIVSGYRSFQRQKGIWNRKYDKFTSQGLSPHSAIKKIIEYSTIPGTSRHHWGTEIDIIDASKKIPKNVLVEENYEGKGVYSSLKKWMDQHSESFGFYLVYTNNEERNGFKYEPWHYSYKSLSDKMLAEFKGVNLINFYKKVKLKGYVYLTNDFLNKYFEEHILDINPQLD